MARIIISSTARKVHGSTAFWMRCLVVLEADQKFEEIFKALESGKLHSEKDIFYNGWAFDAYTFVSDIIRSAKSSITLFIQHFVSVFFVVLKRYSFFNMSKSANY